ncbi:MAG: hypothetical protein JWM80_5187 [Cyanobacteria bacterium RYN_339]|nr:hypothetical protein [Cyanobacteria bacterium RYN_339]
MKHRQRTLGLMAACALASSGCALFSPGGASETTDKIFHTQEPGRLPVTLQPGAAPSALPVESTGAGAGGNAAAGTGTTTSTTTTSGVPIVVPLGFTAPPTQPALPTGVAAIPATGQLVDAATGRILRGTKDALPGEAALPKSDPNSTVTTVDTGAVAYVDAGNTIFVETKGLKPKATYTGTLIWPNGKTTAQDFLASDGGNISSVVGNFIEFPHVGFHHAEVPKDTYGAVTGSYKVELAEKGNATPAQTIFFGVRKRPVLMVTDKDFVEKTVCFSDHNEALFLHGTGFPPNVDVSVSVINDNINRLTPMVDGQPITSKIWENLGGLRFTTDANGNFHQKLISWFFRQPVEGSLVLVGKYLNDADKFVANEDIAIVDHPTFVIKNSKDYFGGIAATDPTALIKGSDIQGDISAPKP